jgi:hypothetical protein
MGEASARRDPFNRLLVRRVGFSDTAIDIVLTELTAYVVLRRWD